LRQINAIEAAFSAKIEALLFCRHIYLTLSYNFWRKIEYMESSPSINQYFMVIFTCTSITTSTSSAE
jgi:hypothetical protein